MRRSALAFAFLFLFAGIVLAAGFGLCKGSNHEVRLPMGAHLERIELSGGGGKKTAAWISEVPTGKAFILAHGNGGDRNSMAARAALFNAMGYTVLLPDLNGHGETPGRWKSLVHFRRRGPCGFVCVRQRGICQSDSGIPRGQSGSPGNGNPVKIKMKER
jgi:pimeloyl-ACP methyl ester carboxylesterase